MSKSKLCLTAVILMLVTACSQVPSNQSCGVLLEYPKEFQTEASKEYSLLPSASRKLLDDYKTTRDTIRVCMKHSI